VKLPRRKFLHVAAAVAALPVVSRIKSARAQDYPAKPVRIITHSAPGGSPDALLRIVGDRLSQMWGRQIVVLNHPGAGGAVAARTAAQAAPDG
jgi:tripartite-type tricarboxylate transporter receptor subunit TctC